MSDSDWVVDDWVESSGEWADNGALVSTGSATAAYWFVSAGTRLYLQADGVSATATPYAFPLAYDAVRQWWRAMQVPAIFDGQVVQEEIRHSDPQREVFEFGHRVGEAPDPTPSTPSNGGARAIPAS